MCFKSYPWVVPTILGGIGLFYLIVQLPLIFGNIEDGHSHSGVPFIGGIHFLVAGLISPCKWLALFCILDYAVIGSVYKIFNPEAYKKNNDTDNAGDKQIDSSE